MKLSLVTCILSIELYAFGLNKYLQGPRLCILKINVLSTDLKSFDHLLYGSWFDFGLVKEMVVHLTKSEVSLFLILQGNMVTVAKLPKGRIDLTRKVLLELKQVFIVSFAVSKWRQLASVISLHKIPFC